MRGEKCASPARIKLKESSLAKMDFTTGTESRHVKKQIDAQTDSAANNRNGNIANNPDVAVEACLSGVAIFLLYKLLSLIN